MPRKKGTWWTPTWVRALAKTVRDPDSECWEWLGSKNPRGYSQIRENGHDGRLRPAHQVLYEHFIGPIPDGYDMDHYVCENHGCVSPHHVRPVTRRENVLRCDGSVSAVNRAKDFCKRGHPLSGENITIDRKGRRCCQTCQKLRNDARYSVVARAILAFGAKGEAV
jgi:hypothetical protein